MDSYFSNTDILFDDESVLHKSDFNMAQSESKLISVLCNCLNKDLPWCFIHDKVNEKLIDDVTVNGVFGFMCEFLGSVPLYRPGKMLKCQKLLPWACEAHTIVTQSGCPNYQSSRIEVVT